MHLKYGDIIAQSVEDFSVNWTSALPSYCMSSPHLASSNIQGCEIRYYFLLVYPFNLADLSPYLVLDEEDEEEESNETKSEEDEAKE